MRTLHNRHAFVPLAEAFRPIYLRSVNATLIGSNTMALLDLGRTRGHTSSFADQIRTRFVNTLGAVADWNDARRTRKVLSQLSSHELDDIGLSRGDIDSISRKRFF